MEEEAQHTTKVVERDCKCTEKEAEEEAQRAAKVVERDRKRDAKWTAEDDATIVSMIEGDFSYSEIASELGNDSIFGGHDP